MQNKPEWTDERVQLVTSYWAAGCSAAEIAEKLGDVSRSAVMGKVSRLGLPKRETILRQRVPISVAEIAFKGIPFVETTDSTCMYPEGDGGSMLFCGQPRQDESSYCQAHHALCHQKPTGTAARYWKTWGRAA